ncbi:hypothetical protein SanaruYs_17990 [Chryseotalea sanaruensis]|uniref:Lipocalin-like domain-containing protein n=2 Tax=Chryseotalea sanaruensis TaxID=2482724 RepID=A0A401U9I3_9BACT|nr:hypothetical protein SanaruYs_17990 [Chryseotalea sanaruensis]
MVKWQLIEMAGNMSDVPPQKGEDMSWQEYYTLQPDSTFTKVRKTDKKMVASGRYAFVKIEDEQYVEFTYDSPNEIIGSCYAEAKETLRLVNGKMFGTWQACDGPGLTYERVTVNCEE